MALSNLDEQDDKSNLTDNKLLLAGNFRFLIGHPENFLDSNNLEIFSRAKWNSFVRHIVVDEAHCVVSWGENFRPKFKEIDQLAAIFPHAAMVALTATATLRMQNEIIRLLGMKNPNIISASTDRPNIKYIVKRRLSNTGKGRTVEGSYSAVFTPVLTELQRNRLEFPKTVVYCSLKWCGYAHELGVNLLSPDVTNTSLKQLAQFHAPLLPEVTTLNIDVVTVL